MRFRKWRINQNRSHMTAVSSTDKCLCPAECVVSFQLTLCLPFSSTVQVIPRVSISIALSFILQTSAACLTPSFPSYFLYSICHGINPNHLHCRSCLPSTLITPTYSRNNSAIRDEMWNLMVHYTKNLRRMLILKLLYVILIVINYLLRKHNKNV